MKVPNVARIAARQRTGTATPRDYESFVADVATVLENVASDLRRFGASALDMAPALASVGYPSGGSGSPGKSADRTSSTERAATSSAPFADVDRDLLLAFEGVITHGVNLGELATRVMVRADARGLRKVPKGAGICPACDTYCGGGPKDRLHGGMCNTDNMAWIRAGRPDRFHWIRERRISKGLTVTLPELSPQRLAELLAAAAAEALVAPVVAPVAATGSAS